MEKSQEGTPTSERIKVLMVDKAVEATGSPRSSWPSRHKVSVPENFLNPSCEHLALDKQVRDVCDVKVGKISTRLPSFAISLVAWAPPPAARSSFGDGIG